MRMPLTLIAGSVHTDLNGLSLVEIRGIGVVYFEEALPKPKQFSIFVVFIKHYNLVRVFWEHILSHKDFS